MSDHIKRLEEIASGRSLGQVYILSDNVLADLRQDLRRALDDVERMEQALTRAGARLDVLAMYDQNNPAVVAGWADQARQALSAPNTGGTHD